jgi:hypothetical protein
MTGVGQTRLKIRTTGGMSMTQVMKAEPDALSKLEFRGEQTPQNPPIGSPEHADLLKAIRQNFPEIFDDPQQSEVCEQFGERNVWSSAMQGTSLT